MMNRKNMEFHFGKAKAADYKSVAHIKGDTDTLILCKFKPLDAPKKQMASKTPEVDAIIEAMNIAYVADASWYFGIIKDYKDTVTKIRGSKSTDT